METNVFYNKDSDFRLRIFPSSRLKKKKKKVLLHIECCIDWNYLTNGISIIAATTLTGFHFTVTALVGLVSNAAGYTSSKQIPLWELVWFSIVANTSIAGMNFSLMLNSVGFYQVHIVIYLCTYIYIEKLFTRLYHSWLITGNMMLSAQHKLSDGAQ